MSEWKECKLGDVVDVSQGLAINKQTKHLLKDDGLPLLRITDMFFDTYAQFIDPVNVPQKCVANKTDIIYTRTGQVGFVFKGKNGVIHNNCFKVKPKTNLDNDFLFWFLKQSSIKELSNNIASGSVQLDLTHSAFKSIDIPLPSLPEQRAIASVLSSLDDKIDLLHRQNKTLEAMAETLFRQWFVEEADEGWDSVRVGDFVHTNVASINKDNALKTIRYLDTGSLTEGKIDGYQTFDIADAPSRARRIVKHDDVLISTVRPNQQHYGILKNPAEDVIVSTGFCVITCDKINPHFIYILLTTDEMTEYLHSIAEGSTSTYPSLKPSDIEGLEFQLPPQEKLDAFSEYAYNIWSKIEYNHTQIHTLSKLRDTLLSKLISGKVRIQYRPEATI